MTIIGQLLWLCLLLSCLMNEDFAFVYVIYHVEISQLICSVERLSEFCLVRGTERKFRANYGFFNCNFSQSFMSLFDRIFIVSIFFMLNLLLHY